MVITSIQMSSPSTDVRPHSFRQNHGIGGVQKTHSFLRMDPGESRFNYTENHKELHEQVLPCPAHGDLKEESFRDEHGPDGNNDEEEEAREQISSSSYQCSCKMWTCGECSKQFTSARALKIHEVKQHENMPRRYLKCSHCEEVFDHSNLLQIHMKVHHNIKVRCPQCKDMFDHPRVLSMHLKAHHAEPVCLVCGVKFDHDKILKLHMEHYHKINKNNPTDEYIPVSTEIGEEGEKSPMGHPEGFTALPLSEEQPLVQAREISPLHNLPLHDHSVRDHPAHDHSRHDHPIHDHPVHGPLHDRPVGDHPMHEHQLRDQPMHDHPMHENPGHEHPVRDHPVRDHPVRDHPVRDHPVRDHPVRDHPVRDHPVRDHPVRDHPVHDNPMRSPEIEHSARSPLLDDRVIEPRVKTQSLSPERRVFLTSPERISREGSLSPRMLQRERDFYTERRPYNYSDDPSIGRWPPYAPAPDFGPLIPPRGVLSPDQERIMRAELRHYGHRPLGRSRSLPSNPGLLHHALVPVYPWTTPSNGVPMRGDYPREQTRVDRATLEAVRNSLRAKLQTVEATLMADDHRREAEYRVRSLERSPEPREFYYPRGDALYSYRPSVITARSATAGDALGLKRKAEDANREFEPPRKERAYLDERESGFTREGARFPRMDENGPRRASPLTAEHPSSNPPRIPPRFASEFELGDHAKMFIKRGAPKCNLCQQTFSSKMEYLHHLILHREKNDLTDATAEELEFLEGVKKNMESLNGELRNARQDGDSQKHSKSHLPQVTKVSPQTPKKEEEAVKGGSFAAQTDPSSSSAAARSSSPSSQPPNAPFATVLPFGTATCSECNDVFADSLSCRMHIEKRHMKPRCRECGVEFDHKNLLKIHMDCYHSNMEVLQCYYCGASFKHRAEFLDHLTTHETQTKGLDTKEKAGENNVEQAESSGRRRWSQLVASAQLPMDPHGRLQGVFQREGNRLRGAGRGEKRKLTKTFSLPTRAPPREGEVTPGELWKRRSKDDTAREMRTRIFMPSCDENQSTEIPPHASRAGPYPYDTREMELEQMRRREVTAYSHSRPDGDGDGDGTRGSKNEYVPLQRDPKLKHTMRESPMTGFPAQRDKDMSEKSEGVGEGTFPRIRYQMYAPQLRVESEGDQSEGTLSERVQNEPIQNERTLGEMTQRERFPNEPTLGEMTQAERFPNGRTLGEKTQSERFPNERRQDERVARETPHTSYYHETALVKIEQVEREPARGSHLAQPNVAEELGSSLDNTAADGEQKEHSYPEFVSSADKRGLYSINPTLSLLHDKMIKRFQQDPSVSAAQASALLTVPRIQNDTLTSSPGSTTDSSPGSSRPNSPASVRRPGASDERPAYKEKRRDSINKLTKEALLNSLTLKRRSSAPDLNNFNSQTADASAGPNTNAPVDTAPAESHVESGNTQKEKETLLAHPPLSRKRSKDIVCQPCGLTFLHKKLLKIHLDSYHGDQQSNKCLQCGGKSFKDKNEFLKHLMAHQGTGEQDNPVNGSETTAHGQKESKSPTNSPAVGLPVDSLAPVLEPRQLTTGDGSSPQRNEIELLNNKEKKNTELQQSGKHQKSHKGHKNKLNTCFTCGKIFENGRQLEQHLSSHASINEDGQCCCSICNKAFDTHRKLEIHSRSHTGFKPHRCDLCGRCFPYYSSYYYHKMTHTKDRPHKCPLCGKGFIQTRYLRAHLKTHKDDQDTSSAEVDSMIQNMKEDGPDSPALSENSLTREDDEETATAEILCSFRRSKGLQSLYNGAQNSDADSNADSPGLFMESTSGSDGSVFSSDDEMLDVSAKE